MNKEPTGPNINPIQMPLENGKFETLYVDSLSLSILYWYIYRTFEFMLQLAFPFLKTVFWLSVAHFMSINIGMKYFTRIFMQGYRSSHVIARISNGDR